MSRRQKLHPAELATVYFAIAKRTARKDRKGGDPSEWPENLRIRQFPEAAR
jgi:hypothetical protein